jgi:hypothetical protein
MAKARNSNVSFFPGASVMKSTHDLSGLMKFSRREPWCDILDEVLEEHLGATLDDYDLDFEELADVIGDDWRSSLWGCAFEDMLTQTWDADEINIVDEYLKRRGWNEKAPNKLYMKALRTSQMSLYEVSEIIPGVSMLARDMIRDAEPILVHERSATQSLNQWDRIGARIVHVAGRNIIAGGLLPFSHDCAEQLMAEFVAILAEAGPDALEKTGSDDLLRATASLFTAIWLHDRLARALGELVPELRNSDGEDIIFHDARFPFAKGATQKAIRAALDALPELRAENGTYWNWIGTAQGRGVPQKAKGQQIATTMDDGAPVLGNITLKDKAMLLSTNSAERAKRGQAMIEAALGGLLLSPLVEIRTPAQLIADGAGDRKEPAESLLSPEETKSVIQGMLENHYRETLDLPVPALGDRTPRDAAKTPEGRKAVANWLKYLENQTTKSKYPADPVATYDLGWMWAELGVEDLRR